MKTRALRALRQRCREGESFLGIMYSQELFCSVMLKREYFYYSTKKILKLERAIKKRSSNTKEFGRL